MQLKKAIFFIAGTSQAFVFKEQDLTCISCVEVDGLLTCESEPDFCLPGVTACVSMQVTQTAQPEIGTIYWRGCELPGHEDIPDGCTCSGERNQAFYCKKTCYTDKCNDDETMSTIDQECKDKTSTTTTTKTTSTTNTTVIESSATTSSMAAALLITLALW